MGEQGRLLKTQEAAELLNVKPRTIYAWVAERRIPFRKAGRLLRFDRAELLAWVAEEAQKCSIADNVRMLK